MRTAKIVIPVLIALGVLLYIYIEASPPTASIPDGPTEAAPVSPLIENSQSTTLSPLPLPTTTITTEATSITAPAVPSAPSNAEADVLTQTPVVGFEIVQVYPHDPAAFTQGLIWLDNIFYEGTGSFIATGVPGRSSLRRVDRDTGSVLKLVDLPEQYFGEGVTVFGNKLYQLTWQSNVGFIYNKNTFEKLAEFTYPTEGWGITHDGQQLIMSDGSATLYRWDPETLEELDKILVTDRGQPVLRLNELEYINGQIYANIWQTDWIAMIDSNTGNVTAWLDLSGILSPAERTGGEDVLNGIAYNAENDTLYVTGKLWPKLFEIRLVAPQ